ncbi:hypothetical protein UFOVP273_42 [uncultured Caudovirales phage]|uniref:Uncharacterized protein n=1 Tax=uncultured Caudovirales phage TaxID=2100421 RepID=A0A6J5LMT5_9CAUD|nr:hypothetical protein UFOVP273_42 [uncultured Caudovirales phage]
MLIDLLKIYQLSRAIPSGSFHVLARMAKVTEEVGEFAESTLVTNGYMRKDLKEPQAGELVDVIITAVDTWLQSNPQFDLQAAESELQTWLDTKFDKWAAKYPEIKV